MFKVPILYPFRNQLNHKSEFQQPFAVPLVGHERLNYGDVPSFHHINRRTRQSHEQIKKVGEKGSRRNEAISARKRKHKKKKKKAR